MVTVSSGEVLGQKRRVHTVPSSVFTERAETAEKPELVALEPTVLTQSTPFLEYNAPAAPEQMVGAEKRAIASMAGDIHSFEPTRPLRHRHWNPSRSWTLAPVAFLAQVLLELFKGLFQASGDVPLQRGEVFQRRRHGILI